MKKYFNLFALICLVITTFSCSENSTKSYTEMVEDEKEAISQFIDEKGFEIIDDYPADGKFKENQFVKLENGLYLNVIDEGDKNDMAEVGETSIFCRFKGNLFMDGDTTKFNNLTTPNSFPVEFIYGSSTVKEPNKTYAFNDFYCEGLSTPLEHVGNNSSVKLIVPFKISSSTFMSAGLPLFFEKVNYKFNK